MSDTKNVKKVSKGEARCKRVMESIFKKPFTKQRPEFLTNGNRFELDCYNEQLALTVEYNRKQHYHHISFFIELMTLVMIKYIVILLKRNCLNKIVWNS